MTREEWVEAAVLELVNDGNFYALHGGKKHKLENIAWGNISSNLSAELFRRKPPNVCEQTKVGLLNYYGHLEEKQETNLCCEITLPPKQEETKMNTKVVVKTFVGNVEATAMTDDQIFGAILKEEQDIADMEKIQNKPKKLIKQIEERKVNIAKLVEIVDSRS